MSYIALKDLSIFKIHYNKAVKSRKSMFKFQSKDVLVSYAKYVIEYLEGMKNAKA